MTDSRTVTNARDGWGQSRLNESDLQLVRRARKKSASHTDELLERLRLIPKILRAQNARLGSPMGEHALDDLAQDVFVVIWRKLADYDGTRPLEAWAYRICRFELMNGIRRQSRHAMSDVHPDHPDREESGAVLDYEEVHRAIEKLPDDEASVVQSKHFGGLTFDEIGERLSISSNTAKTRYYRGLTRLGEYLRDRIGPLEGPKLSTAQRGGS